MDPSSRRAQPVLGVHFIEVPRETMQHQSMEIPHFLVLFGCYVGPGTLGGRKEVEVSW